MRASIPCILVALLLVLPAVAQEEPQKERPELRFFLAVDPTEVTVGQPFALTLTVEYPPELEVQLPEPAQSWGSLAVRQAVVAQRGEAADGWVSEVAVYQLAAFELGALEILPQDLLVRQGDDSWMVTTPAAGIQVNSILPAQEGEEEQPELADLKEQASLPLSMTRVLLLSALALALLAALAYFLWRRRRRQPLAAQSEVLPPPLPADEEALQALQALLAGPLLAQGKLKEYHVRLATIVKRYLNRRFAVPTMERTTFEVVQSTRLAPVEVWVPARVAALLSACDFVKFARQRPELDRCRGMVEEARTLVEQTRPLPPAPPVEQAAPGEA